jgi:hypothetical protein
MSQSSTTNLPLQLKTSSEKYIVDKIPGWGILVNKQGHVERAWTKPDIRSANDMRFPGSGEGKIRTEHETNKFENLKINALEAKSIKNRIRWYGHILRTNVDRIPRRICT